MRGEPVAATADGYGWEVLCSGDVLHNRYRLTGPIATGGMGEVWRAMDVSLGRMVAVKLLRPDLLPDPEFDARFQAEAQTMRR